MTSTLTEGEPHPSALDALEWVLSLGTKELTLQLSIYSSCAIEGNRLGEICAGTLDRLLNNKPVSDRYILGLAYALRECH